MENKKGRYQVTVNPLETNGLPASLYFTSKFADEVGSEFIADFENPVNAQLVCKRLNDYTALQAKCDRYEKEQKEKMLKLVEYIRENYKPSKEVWKDKFGIALLSDEGILSMFNQKNNEALNGEGEKAEQPELGDCQRCNIAKATTTYSDLKVCAHCDKMLNDEFDEEYR